MNFISFTLIPMIGFRNLKLAMQARTAFIFYYMNMSDFRWLVEVLVSATQVTGAIFLPPDIWLYDLWTEYA